MNKSKPLSMLISIGLLLLISSCVNIPMGHTPSEDIVTNTDVQKYDVTFSIEYKAEGSISRFRASHPRYIDTIRKYLIDSQSFRTVTYCNFEGKSSYHIHFIIHYSGLPKKIALRRGVLSVYTLFAIPIWRDNYLDMSAQLFLGDELTYSLSTSENLRLLFWLPAFPASLVWNQLWAWTTQEKKCCRYLINGISRYQMTGQLVKTPTK